MRAELPEIARSGQRRCIGFDLRHKVCVVIRLHGADDEPVDLSRVETGNLDIEVELDRGERLELDREKLLVPAGQLGQAVVGNDVGTNLCFGEVAQPDRRNLLQAEQLRRFQTPVARHDPPALVDEYWVRPAKDLDRLSDLPDLLLRMCTGVTRVRLQGGGLPPISGPALKLEFGAG